MDCFYEHGEFVTAEACRSVSIPQTILKAFGHRYQKLVAGGVTH